MAILTKGILGEFTGKIGDIVGSKWKGVQVIKNAPARRKSRPSRAQIEQQAKFIMLVRFLKPLLNLLNCTFGRHAKRMSGYNKAMSVNKAVIIGSYPSYRIDYEKVLLSPDKCSRDHLQLIPTGKPGILKYSAGEAGRKKNSGLGILLFIAAYSESSGEWIHVLHPRLRKDGCFLFDIKPFTGQGIHLFAGFRNADNRMPAVYLGKSELC